MPQKVQSPWEQTIAAAAMQRKTTDGLGNRRSSQLHKEQQAKEKEAQEAARQKQLEEEKQRLDGENKKRKLNKGKETMAEGNGADGNETKHNQNERPKDGNDGSKR